MVAWTTAGNDNFWLQKANRVAAEMLIWGFRMQSPKPMGDVMVTASVFNIQSVDKSHWSGLFHYLFVKLVFLFVCLWNDGMFSELPHKWSHSNEKVPNTELLNIQSKSFLFYIYCIQALYVLSSCYSSLCTNFVRQKREQLQQNEKSSMISLQNSCTSSWLERAQIFSSHTVFTGLIVIISVGSSLESEC